MKDDKKRELTPRLRFPEFCKADSWDETPLREFADIINDRAGDTKCIPLSITSGVGLISQEEKFGRTIAGSQYKNYVVLQKNDFAYNKSATKDYPQGYLALYSGDERAAVPNSIFTCFRVQADKVDPEYLNFLFWGNIHGRWLKRYITVGARAHGSLNIDDDDLLALPIPRPSGSTSIAEQQKIADCLSSVDELIAAQTQKLTALKAHKKGLMQNLFPREGETIPRYRFPEFQNAPEWEGRPLGKLGEIITGKTPSTKDVELWGGDIRFITPTDISDDSKYQYDTQRTVVETENTKVLPKGTIVYTCIASIGKIAITVDASVTNQQINAIVPNDDVNGEFIYYALLNITPWIKTIPSSSTLPIINKTEFSKIHIPITEDKEEQQKIADCLSSIDEKIAFQSQKLEALKTHKKGLMQQLFPSMEAVES